MDYLHILAEGANWCSLHPDIVKTDPDTMMIIVTGEIGDLPECAREFIDYRNKKIAGHKDREAVLRSMGLVGENPSVEYKPHKFKFTGK